MPTEPEEPTRLYADSIPDRPAAPDSLSLEVRITERLVLDLYREHLPRKPLETALAAVFTERLGIPRSHVFTNTEGTTVRVALLGEWGYVVYSARIPRESRGRLTAVAIDRLLADGQSFAVPLTLHKELEA